MASLKYTHAVVCRIPNSWHSKTLSLDIDIARKQHEIFTSALRSIGLDVIELPSDESLPNCSFVEDTAIICNGAALMTQPPEESRRKEVQIMKSILKKELEIPVIEMADPKARLEGGDVLFTGKEFFVGLSTRTNEEGALAVAKAFPDYPCVPVKVTGFRHLKSCVTMAGPDILCIGRSPAAQTILKRLEREASFDYKTITVPDDAAANCIYVNGKLLHRAQVEFPESYKVFEDKMESSRIPLNVSHMSKPEGALSCSCLLIRRTKLSRV